jgi:carboxyl-terminal processing protease
MPPDRKEDFDIHMRGSLEGIGALLREEYGLIKVVRIIPGSASAKEGRLQAEDIILAVAEKGGTGGSNRYALARCGPADPRAQRDRGPD